MALKSKRVLPESDTEKITPETEISDNTHEEKEPYRVFETEEDFKRAVMEEGNREQPEREGNYRGRSIVEGWQCDATALKELIPEFDLGEMLKEQAFTDALKKGFSIIEAYAAVSRLPKHEPREAIHQNAQLAQRGTGEATRNPAKLSSQDFKSYIEDIRNR